MQAEQAFSLSQAATDYLQHASGFLAVGAVGFRLAAVRGRDDDTSLADGEILAYRDALANAARLGLVGALVSAYRWLSRLPGIAERRQLTVLELVTGDVPTAVRIVLVVLGIFGLAVAATRRPGAWRLAVPGVLLAPLTGLLAYGDVLRLANPVHLLVGGLWLGTLLVLVVCGIPAALRRAPRERRGAMVADMVNGFSPLALFGASALVLSGITTAWRHIGSYDALFTSSYGQALLVKLGVVLVVFLLGAFNWQRQRPGLGTEDTARRIRRSSAWELAAAATVLAVTVYLLQQPAPAEAQGAPPPPAAAAQDSL